MKESKSVTKDPICGMTVDEATALHAERDGKTFYFCSDHCRQKFLSTPAGVKPDASLEAAVDSIRSMWAKHNPDMAINNPLRSRNRWRAGAPSGPRFASFARTKN